jgi:hypothetical protein
MSRQLRPVQTRHLSRQLRPVQARLFSRKIEPVQTRHMNCKLVFANKAHNNKNNKSIYLQTLQRVFVGSSTVGMRSHDTFLRSNSSTSTHGHITVGARAVHMHAHQSYA